MTTDFCLSALAEALALYSTPDIFNTDQGSQVTSGLFTQILREADVAISMNGAGRAIDDVFIERLWRTLKYDHIYLNPAESGNACRDGIGEFLDYYNQERPHSSLDDQTPDEPYCQTRTNQRVARTR
jgi:putative transposase